MEKNDPEYQCPQCLWVGTTEELEDTGEGYVCPTCYVRFDCNWEEWDEDSD